MTNITPGLGDVKPGSVRLQRISGALSNWGKVMPIVRARLSLFGGDTVVIRCSEKCHIHLMCESEVERKGRHSGFGDILTVNDQNTAYVGIPYKGIWNVLIDSKCDSLEHSISYLPA